MELAELDINIDQLSGLSVTEQAWRIESAERELDELERRVANNADMCKRIGRMRDHIVEIQRQLYGL